MARDLVIDRLPDTATPLQVVLVEDASFGTEAPQGAREPHRHDYHELIWTRRRQRRAPDRRRALARWSRATITLIGRGQVHVFQRASAPRRRGHPLRGGDAGRRRRRALADRGPRRAHGRRSRRRRPKRWTRRSATLAAETQRPSDARSLELQRHFLSAILLWVERWYDATRTERRDADDADQQLHRRFATALERDFARHHDAAPLRRRARRPTRTALQGARAEHRPHDQAADHRPRDARGRPAAALHAT